MTSIDRRAAMTIGALAMAGAGLRPAAAATAKQPIVLVHGAWHGAWAWARLVPLLIEAGHPVTTVELSGLGANAHRQAPEIGLHVHGQDVLNHLFFHDIKDAVVVGHSYGGCVLSEALGGDTDGRIAHAVYLDALVPKQGEALASHIPPDIAKRFEGAAAAGKMIPPRPPELWEKMWGLTGEVAAFAGPRLRPMSARCFTEAVQGNPDARDGKRTFIRCTQNANKLFDKFDAMTKADARFANTAIDGHHDVMVIDPPLMRDALLAVL